MNNQDINKLFYLHAMNEQRCSSEKEILKTWKNETKEQVSKILDAYPEWKDTLREIESEICSADCLNDIGKYYCENAEYNDEQEYLSARVMNLSLMDLYVRMCDALKIEGSMYQGFRELVCDFFGA